MTRLHFLRGRILAAPPRGLAGLFCMALAVALPTFARAGIDSWVTGTTFVAYYPFVLLSAIVLGWRRALVVTLLSAAVANFLFMSPRFTFFAGSGDTAGAVSFVFSSLLIVLLTETVRRNVAEVEASRSHEAHLNRELQHRVTNTLAVIQGLATQSFREPCSAAELRLFQSRLRALADANDILTSGRWETCRLPDLAARALGPFNRTGAINLYGPACTLREESCVPLVLALHELATNAVKYGALSNPQGSVDLVWSLAAGSAQKGRLLVLEWSERDGPVVLAPVRRGLGSRLLRPQPGIAGVELTFPADGVRCRLHLPNARILAEGGNAGAPAVPATLYSTGSPPGAVNCASISAT
jgi:two-component sensor histidine kinase